MSMRLVFKAIADTLNPIINTIFDPIFGPLLKLPFLLSIIIISLLISLLIIFIYKKITNQSLMKDLKDEIKELQKQMKALRDKPKEMMKVNKRAMEVNMKYMMHSMKPTLFTFLPIIIIFGWLNTHIAYYPLVEDQIFTVTLDFAKETEGNVEVFDVQDIQVLNSTVLPILNNQAIFAFKGSAGEYTLKFKYDDYDPVEKDIIITKSIEERVYKKPVEFYNDGGIKSIKVNNEKIMAFKGIPVLQDLPWVGNFGWLGSYILFSLIFSLGLRKLLKVY